MKLIVIVFVELFVLVIVVLKDVVHQVNVLTTSSALIINVDQQVGVLIIMII